MKEKYIQLPPLPADMETFKEFVKNYENVEVSDEFREYIETIKRLVGRVIIDSYGMAAMIYQKRCVEKMNVDEISEECGVPAEKIQLFVDYFDARRKMLK